MSYSQTIAVLVVGAIVGFLALLLAYRLGKLVARRAHADQMATAKSRIDRLAKMAKGAHQ